MVRVIIEGVLFAVKERDWKRLFLLINGPEDPNNDEREAALVWIEDNGKRVREYIHVFNHGS